MEKICMAILTIAILSLGGCGGEIPDAPIDTNQPDKKPISSVSNAMDKLVELGAYPKLNRDSDVAGPDVDGNGVRDDLDAYVASLPDTEQQKKAMLQSFASIQYRLTAQNLNEETIKKGIKLTISSRMCLYKHYGSEAKNKAKDVVMFTINTRERDDAYNAFNEAATGYGGKVNPKESRESCL